MTKIAFTTLAIFAAAALAGCNQKTQDAASNTADSAATDFNATTRNAVDDVSAASDKALGAAQNSIDSASPSFNRAAESVGNAADRAQANTRAALKDAGNAVER